MTDIVILAATRTPIGNFQGAFASTPASELGATAIRGAVVQAGVTADKITDVLMGNVLQAGQGQAPTRQAAIQKIEALTRLIDVHDFRYGIIFCSTKVMVDDLDEHLHSRGYT